MSGRHLHSEAELTKPSDAMPCVAVLSQQAHKLHKTTDPVAT